MFNRSVNHLIYSELNPFNNLVEYNIFIEEMVINNYNIAYKKLLNKTQSSVKIIPLPVYQTVQYTKESLTAIFLIPRMLLLSSWCGALSISAIGESHDKSKLAKYFQNSYALESFGG